MKYDVHDGEIVIHQRDSDVFLPLSLAEMQHVVDVMNALNAKSGEDKLAAIAALVQDVQNDCSLKGEPTS